MGVGRFSVATDYQDLGANPDFATDFPNEPAPAPVMNRPHSLDRNVDHSLQSVGEVTIPDGADDGDEFSVDFGDVEEAKVVRLENNCRQDLDIAFNGGSSDFSLPHGGILALYIPADADTPLTSIELTPTAHTPDSQVGDGFVQFIVLGEGS